MSVLFFHLYPAIRLIDGHLVKLKPGACGKAVESLWGNALLHLAG
jgi:hypothetical protein